MDSNDNEGSPDYYWRPVEKEIEYQAYCVLETIQDVVNDPDMEQYETIEIDLTIQNN